MPETTDTAPADAQAFPWDLPPDAAPDAAPEAAEPGRAGEQPSAALALVEARSLRSLLDVRDPVQIQLGVGMIRDELLAALGDIVTEARRHRAAADEILRPTDLRGEATRIADAVDLLAGIGGAFAAAADTGRALACDLIDELPARVDDQGEAHRPKSLRVGDGHGFDLVAKREARSELSVDHEAVDHVLVGAAEIPDGTAPRDYLLGFRAGLDALRAVLASSPTYRSTALDALLRSLEDADSPLAPRLARAYSRVDKGEPRPKLDRVEPAKRGRR